MPFCVSLIFDKNVSKKFKEVQLASVGLKRRWVNSQNGFFGHEHANVVNIEVIFCSKIFQHSLVGWPEFGTIPIIYQYFGRKFPGNS